MTEVAHPISDLSDEYRVQPRVIYGWMTVALDNLSAALDANAKGAPSRDDAVLQENEALRARVAKKDSVIAKISKEYVTLKKSLGVP